jgi:DtxR family transcriptional regulator, Mn-dependent transcriptional regulator
MDSTTEVWKEFSENEITHSAAHHLLAIYELHQKRGYARVTDVAKFLDITTGSASTNLKSLRSKGLIDEDDNKFLSLSEEGKRLAEAIMDRRGVLEEFFIKVLNISEHQAGVDACKTEHLLSSETTKKMREFTLKYSKKK